MTSSISELDLPPEHPLRQIMDTLAAHPELREPLLRVLLTEDFLALPGRMNEVQEQLGELRENFEEFREETREQFRQVNERLDENTRGLAEANRRLDENTRGLDENTRGLAEANRKLDENTRGLAEANRRLDENTRGLAEANRKLDENTRGLEENTRGLAETNRRLDENTRRLDENTRGLAETNRKLDENTRIVRTLRGHVGRLLGQSYEDLCRREISVILDGLLDRPALADREQIDRLLLQARRNNEISRNEYQDGLRVDIIAREEDDESQTVRLAVVEVSITFNQGDLETAARRAEIIGRVTGARTDAFVATHHAWPDEANEAARRLGVVLIRNEAPEYEDE